VNPDSRSPDLILVRHFPSPLNERKVSRGWLSVGIDKELAAKLAPHVAETLKKYGVDTLHSSDLPRGEQSAKLIAREMGEDVETESTPKLRTWNTGDKVAGKPEKETIPLRQKYLKNSDIEMPGGESWDDFMDRYGPQIKPMVGKKGKAMVAHGHHILGISEALTGEKTDPQKLGGLDENFPPAAVFGVWQQNGNVRIERLDKGDKTNARNPA